MDTNAIDLLTAEAVEAAETVDQAMEGLIHTLEQDDIRPDTRSQVESLLGLYRQRDGLLDGLRASLLETRGWIMAVLLDGHPEEPTQEVNNDVLEDIDQNLETQTYARTRYVLRALTVSGTFEAGEQHAP